MYQGELFDYESCRLCPRECRINRNTDRGFCKAGSILRIGRASLHMWEEPCISGRTGSGAVFFAGCNMRCVFCQNKDISTGNTGKEITIVRLTEIFHELKERGACNINLVTGDIYIPSIRLAIRRAKDEGMILPFILNTSSYVSVDALKSLEGLIDIYLPDMKYIRDEDSVKYSNARGYTPAAKEALDEMIRQQPECVYSEDGLLKKGVVVRHLLMPGMLIQAKLTVKYLYERYGDRIVLSLLDQYTPNGCLSGYPEIDRKVTETEYRSLVNYAASLGIVNAYVQEKEAADEAFIPEFDLRGV